MLYPLKFQPVYKDYIWGGNNLLKLNKKLTFPITAESWEISANKDGMSIVSNGDLSGSTLDNVFKWYPKELCGNNNIQQFPLLIKLIDACSALSVQVHPNDTYANENENGALGKNEMWYIIDATPDAKLVYGLKKGITKEDFVKAVYENEIESTLNYIHVKKGDWLNIPAGLVHAIGEGIIIMEVQQNSNTTYRVYDYNRIGADGKKRPLHIEKALDVINFNESEMQVNKIVRFGSSDYLVYNKYFAVELVESDGLYKSDTKGSSFHTYTVIEGSFNVDGVSVELGESVLIPACMDEYSLKGVFKAIKSFVPDITRRFVC
jgi:mannose-6-phosphate isomerase